MIAISDLQDGFLLLRHTLGGCSSKEVPLSHTVYTNNVKGNLFLYRKVTQSYCFSINIMLFISQLWLYDSIVGKVLILKGPIYWNLNEIILKGSYSWWEFFFRCFTCEKNLNEKLVRTIGPQHKHKVVCDLQKNWNETGL